MPAQGGGASFVGLGLAQARRVAGRARAACRHVRRGSSHERRSACFGQLAGDERAARRRDARPRAARPVMRGTAPVLHEQRLVAEGNIEKNTFNHKNFIKYLF
jgi:hypothetical protein